MGKLIGRGRFSLRREKSKWAEGGASALPLKNGRDDPARSSVDFSECGSEYEEEDLASGGRD
jgi:hypothetical protein